MAFTKPEGGRSGRLGPPAPLGVVSRGTVARYPSSAVPSRQVIEKPPARAVEDFVDFLEPSGSTVIGIGHVRARADRVEVPHQDEPNPASPTPQPFQRAEITPVHGNDDTGMVHIPALHPPCDAVQGDPVGSSDRQGSGVRSLPGVIAPGSRRVDLEPQTQATSFGQTGEDPFCKWGPADVPQADKKNGNGLSRQRFRCQWSSGRLTTTSVPVVELRLGRNHLFQQRRIWVVVSP